MQNAERRKTIVTWVMSVMFCSAFCLLPSDIRAQTVADKTVASVTNGARSTPDLITYSDIVWQLALEPNRPITDKPSTEALNESLRKLEDQLLILQEAQKLPLAETSEAQEEFQKTVKERRDELAQSFGSRARLEERMARVGLTSEQLDSILRDRVTIERYLDFRFRAFALVSPREISDSYEKEYRSQRNSGRIVPTLDQVRDRIERRLTEEKIAEEIGKFVDNLREGPGTEIVIITPL
jgi:vacuolar-type H+-ATPase subunit I/STV1